MISEKPNKLAQTLKKDLNVETMSFQPLVEKIISTTQFYNSLLITFIKNCKRATFWKIILLKVRVDFLIIDFPNFLPLIFQPYQQAIIITKRFILKGKNIIIISI